MRYQIECYDGFYGNKWCVRDTARGALLIPHNYNPDEAEYLCQALNALCRETPRPPRQDYLQVVSCEGRPALTVLPGGAA